MSACVRACACVCVRVCVCKRAHRTVECLCVYRIHYGMVYNVCLWWIRCVISSYNSPGVCSYSRNSFSAIMWTLLYRRSSSHSCFHIDFSCFYYFSQLFNHHVDHWIESFVDFWAEMADILSLLCFCCFLSWRAFLTDASLQHGLALILQLRQYDSRVLGGRCWVPNDLWLSVLVYNSVVLYERRHVDVETKKT